MTIVELMDQIIPGADKDLVTPLQKQIAKQYENIFLKAKVTKVEAKPEGLVVSFEGDSAPASDTFDRILVAYRCRERTAIPVVLQSTIRAFGPPYNHSPRRYGRRRKETRRRQDEEENADPQAGESEDCDDSSETAPLPTDGGSMEPSGSADRRIPPPLSSSPPPLPAPPPPCRSNAFAAMSTRSSWA